MGHDRREFATTSAKGATAPEETLNTQHSTPNFEHRARRRRRQETQTPPPRAGGSPLSVEALKRSPRPPPDPRPPTLSRASVLDCGGPPPLSPSFRERPTEPGVHNQGCQGCPPSLEIWGARLPPPRSRARPSAPSGRKQRSTTRSNRWKLNVERRALSVRPARNPPPDAHPVGDDVRRLKPLRPARAAPHWKLSVER